MKTKLLIVLIAIIAASCAEKTTELTELKDLCVQWTSNSTSSKIIEEQIERWTVEKVNDNTYGLEINGEPWYLKKVQISNKDDSVWMIELSLSYVTSMSQGEANDIVIESFKNDSKWKREDINGIITFYRYQDRIKRSVLIEGGKNYRVVNLFVNEYPQGR